MRGTSTSSGSDSMHTSSFTIILYKPYTITISAYLRPSHVENYTRVVAFKLSLQRASFYSEQNFPSRSTTAKLLLLYTYRTV